MIREILSEKIADLIQKEMDEKEKAMQRINQHKEAISNAEKQITKLLARAQIDSFKKPDETYPALIIVYPPDHFKGSFKKVYELFLGYSSKEIDDEVNTIQKSKIGLFEISMPYIFNDFDFSDLFESENPYASVGANCQIFTFM